MRKKGRRLADRMRESEWVRYVLSGERNTQTELIPPDDTDAANAAVQSLPDFDYQRRTPKTTHSERKRVTW